MEQRQCTQYLLKSSFLHLISDVEELSARLMHTLVDIRSIENGQIILEESNKDRVFNPLEVRCVYLEQLLGKRFVLFGLEITKSTHGHIL